MAQPFIFISYSREDESEKDILLTHLKGLQQAGRVILWSDDKIKPGVNWQESIAQAIARADIALLLVTANYLASDFITNEEVPALLSRQAQAGLKVIPIIAKPCAWQVIDWLAPLQVRPKSRKPIWGEEGRTADHELVLIVAEDIVAIHIHNLPEVTPSKDTIPDCPYRGLFAFRPEHAHLFFGRETFIQKLVQAVESRSLVAVLGASGSGKSSVVLAGLVPVLNTSGLWLFTTFRPGDDPFLSLAGALVPLLYRNDLDIIDKIDNTRKLATKLQEGMLLPDVLKMIHQTQPDKHILIIADQFEELYTLCPKNDIRQRFLDMLLSAVDEFRDLSIHLLLTLRADFLGQASLYRPFADILQGRTELLGPMNHSELTEAIEKPAELQGVRFEAKLIDRILDDVGKEEGCLPLLEFALTELWQRQHQYTLTHTAYSEIGEVKGALSRHADQVYQRLSSIEQEQAKQAFMQLVNLGSGIENTRRRATRTELEAYWSLMFKLASERLVVTNRSQDDKETVELVHEALIREWQKLRDWVEEDRVNLQLHRKLTEDALVWQQNNKDESYLYRGARLEALAEWLERDFEKLGELEREFLEESLKLNVLLHKAELRNKVWATTGSGTFGGVLGGLVGSIIFSILANQPLDQIIAAAIGSIFPVASFGFCIGGGVSLAEIVGKDKQWLPIIGGLIAGILPGIIFTLIFDLSLSSILLGGLAGGMYGGGIAISVILGKKLSKLKRVLVWAVMGLIIGLLMNWAYSDYFAMALSAFGITGGISLVLDHS